MLKRPEWGHNIEVEISISIIVPFLNKINFKTKIKVHSLNWMVFVLCCTVSKVYQVWNSI